MSGGTISRNTLDPAGKGAGVEFFTESTEHGGIHYYTRMKMSGSAKVDTDNDVYLNNSRMITVDGELTGSAPVACITPKNYSAGLQVLDGSKVGTEHIKFTVTPNGSEQWIVGNSGTLLNFGAISLDEIKALESSMSPYLITNRENLVNKLLFYKTSDGNYGVMVITEVNATSHGGLGHIKFNYKTFNADGSVKQNRDNCELEGTYSFDLDAETAIENDYDFFLNNSSTQNLKPEHGAKFYVLP